MFDDKSYQRFIPPLKLIRLVRFEITYSKSWHILEGAVCFHLAFLKLLWFEADWILYVHDPIMLLNLSPALFSLNSTVKQQQQYFVHMLFFFFPLSPSLQVPLTWSYGKCMFAYFKPKMLPEFDGYKTSSMSGDLENLFLRITKVIPSGERPEDSVEKIHAYIDGSSDDVPTLSAGVLPNRSAFSK